MEQAYASKATGEIVRRGQTARRFAERYDFESYVAPMWNGFLEKGEWR